MTAPRRPPPVNRGAPGSPLPLRGQHERPAPRRASLKELMALAADVGLPPVYAQAWHGRRLNIEHARADAAHRLRLRRALTEGRMGRAALRA
jgi:hypothetical protein